MSAVPGGSPGVVGGRCEPRDPKPVVTMDLRGRIWVDGAVVGPSVQLVRDFTGPQLLALKDFLDQLEESR